jgi:hypothetical protein
MATAAVVLLAPTQVGMAGTAAVITVSLPTLSDVIKVCSLPDAKFDVFCVLTFRSQVPNQNPDSSLKVPFF